MRTASLVIAAYLMCVVVAASWRLFGTTLHDAVPDHLRAGRAREELRQFGMIGAAIPRIEVERRAPRAGRVEHPYLQGARPGVDDDGGTRAAAELSSRHRPAVAAGLLAAAPPPRAAVPAEASASC